MTKLVNNTYIATLHFLKSVGLWYDHGVKFDFEVDEALKLVFFQILSRIYFSEKVIWEIFGLDHATIHWRVHHRGF